MLAFVVKALLALLLAACAPTSYGVTFQGDDPRALSQAVSEDLAAWDNTVGYRHPGIELRLSGEGAIPRGGITVMGETRWSGEWRSIEIDLDAVRTSGLDPRAALRHVMWHELVHAHLCTDVHNPDPAHLMAYLVTPKNLYAPIGPDTVAAVWATLEASRFPR